MESSDLSLDDWPCILYEGACDWLHAERCSKTSCLFHKVISNFLSVFVLNAQRGEIEKKKLSETSGPSEENVTPAIYFFSYLSAGVAPDSNKPETSDGKFPSVLFIHLRQPSGYEKAQNFCLFCLSCSCAPVRVVSQVTVAHRFLWLWRATVAVCHYPVGHCYLSW